MMMRFLISGSVAVCKTFLVFANVILVSIKTYLILLIPYSFSVVLKFNVSIPTTNTKALMKGTNTIVKYLCLMHQC